MILALTGGTGFVGRATIAAAVAAGHHVPALARRPQPPQTGVEWVAGDLADRAALGRLCQGADAVLHIAGRVSAPDRASFDAANVDGTAAVVRAAVDAGVRRFVHVSSLAAREPDLSDYGGSKAGAEAAARAFTGELAIVRPPGVYGPGDAEMRDVFRLAAWGLAVVPPPGRVSLIHVDDLAQLLVALATSPAPPALTEPAGGPSIDHHRLAYAIGRAVGRPRPLVLSVPAPLLAAVARLDRRLRGEDAKLTPDRARYLVHPDWSARPELAPPPALWSPAIALDDGLAATARWYRDAGWL